MSQTHSYRYAMHDARQLTLGGLIAALEALPLTYDSHGSPKPKHVYFDFGLTYPVRLTSYRGSYSELAITFGHSGFDDHGRRKTDGTSWSAEAPALLTELKRALTTEFYGYKGGEYRMTAETPVWVAQWGEAGYTAVVGVRDIGAEVILRAGGWDAYREHFRRQMDAAVLALEAAFRLDADERIEPMETPEFIRRVV